CSTASDQVHSTHGLGKIKLLIPRQAPASVLAVVDVNNASRPCSNAFMPSVCLNLAALCGLAGWLVNISLDKITGWRPPVGLANYCQLANKRCLRDRKSTRLNSSHVSISYAVFCLKKKTIIKC